MTAFPYTLQSFVELAQRENRRGRDISRLDSDVGRVTRQLRAARKRYRDQASRLDRHDPARAELRAEYRGRRSELRLARDRAVEAVLETATHSFEKKLVGSTFTFGLHPGPLVGTKPTFQISRDLDVTYPAKQASASLRAAAALESPSRNGTVRALKAALSKPYQHSIIKLDVREFFESIPHALLLSRLDRYASLDSVTIVLTRQLLSDFKRATGHDRGVPRGVGMSSNLAELYLAEFDIMVKTHPGVLFYARYVDDVIVVTEDDSARIAVQSSMTESLQNMGLAVNDEKTHFVSTDSDGNYPSGSSLDYLGYSFVRINGELVTGLTDKRKARRIERLKDSFEAWLATTPTRDRPNHGHNGLLLDRVRFLAGNTKLLNSKSNVAVGLYFSNSALDTGSAELNELDITLRRLTMAHSSKMTIKMHNRMTSVSFSRMFEQKSFLRFDQKQVERIVSLWEK